MGRSAVKCCLPQMHGYHAIMNSQQLCLPAQDLHQASQKSGIGWVDDLWASHHTEAVLKVDCWWGRENHYLLGNTNWTWVIKRKT